MRSVLILLFCAGAALAQTAFRVDPVPVVTTTGTVPVGGFPVLYAVAHSAIHVCTDSACATPATTYTDATASVVCPGTAQVVLAGTTACVSTADNQGNFGFWLTPGQYYYQVTLPSGQILPGTTTGYPITTSTANSGTYTAPYTGAVQEGVSAALARTVSVVDFGAVGNGSTDDHAAIQAAINAVGAAGGGKIIFPCKTYSLGGTWLYVAYSNITFDGQGCASLWQAAPPGYMYCFLVGYSTADGSGVAVRVHDVRFSGLTFLGSADGTGTNSSYAMAVYAPVSYSKGVGGSYNIFVDHCNASAFSAGFYATGVTGFYYGPGNFTTGMKYVAALSAGGHGVVVDSSFGVWVYNNRFVAQPGTGTAGDRHAIYIEGSSGSHLPPEDVHVIDNDLDWRTPAATTGYENALQCLDCQGTIISGNRVRGGHTGIELGPRYTGLKDVTVDHNVITETLTGVTSFGGIITDYQAGLTNTDINITNNVITETQFNVYGIALTGTTNGVVSGNVVSVAGAASFGIEIYASTNIQLGPNVLQGNAVATYGEAVYAASTNILRIPGVNVGFGAPLFVSVDSTVTNSTQRGLVWIDPATLEQVSDPRWSVVPSTGDFWVGNGGDETSNPGLYIWGTVAGVSGARAGGLMLDPSGGDMTVSGYHQVIVRANVNAGSLPTSGKLVAIFGENSDTTPVLAVNSSTTTGTHVFEVTGNSYFNGAIDVPDPGALRVGHASCWKAGSWSGVQPGYCSSVVASDGTCTCN